MITSEALDALVEEWRKRTTAGRPMPVTSEMLNNLREGMAAHGEADILRSERNSLSVDVGIARAERDAALQRCAALEAKLAAATSGLAKVKAEYDEQRRKFSWTVLDPATIEAVEAALRTAS